MKKITIFALLIASIGVGQTKWVTGYMPNWDYSEANTREFIGQGVFTHLILFAVGVDGSGNLTDDGTNTLAGEGPGFIDACHDSSIKAMFCIFPHQPSVINAIGSSRAAFCHSIAQEIRTRGWDGVDFDYEDGFTTGLDYSWGGFMHDLRDTLDATGTALGKSLYITAFTFGDAAGSWWPSSAYVDKFSLAGYEMAGAWGGWPVWHGYCLYSGGFTLPCCPDRTNGNFDSLWVSWVRQGHPRSKLLISNSTGVSTWNGGLMTQNLYGAPFTSGNGALHAGDWWEDPGGVGPNVGVGDYTNYTNVVNQYGAYPEQYDSVVVATYKVVDNPGNSDDHFISYAGPKIFYKDYRIFAVDSGGGGMMVWNGWRGRLAANVFPQLAALKRAIAGETLPGAPTGTFTATPDTFGVGGGTTVLSWTSSNATSVSISPAIGSVAANGSTSVTISGPVTFTLILQGPIESTTLTKHIGVAAGSGGTSNGVTDNFNRANSNTLTDAQHPWVASLGSPSLGINNNQCNGVAGAGYNYYNAVFSDSQFATITPKQFSAGARYNYVGVRVQTSGGGGYWMKIDGTVAYLVRRNTGGAETILQTLSGVGFNGSTDSATIYAQGTKIRCFKNGIQVSIDQIDNTFPTGKPGVGLFPDNGCYLDNFSAGSLVGGSPPPPPPPIVTVGKRMRMLKP